MSETIIVGIISAGSALLGVVVSQIFEARRRKSQHDKWYADFFLGRKIDALHNLYSTLVDCHFTLNFYGNMGLSSIEEYKEKITPKVDAYLRTKVMASLYLNDEANKIMGEALGAFRQGSLAIWLSLPADQLPVNPETYDSSSRRFDWTGFNSSHDKAVEALRNLLNPYVLRQLQSKD